MPIRRQRFTSSLIQNVSCVSRYGACSDLRFYDLRLHTFIMRRDAGGPAWIFSAHATVNRDLRSHNAFIILHPAGAPAVQLVIDS